MTINSRNQSLFINSVNSLINATGAIVFFKHKLRVM